MNLSNNSTIPKILLVILFCTIFLAGCTSQKEADLDPHEEQEIADLIALHIIEIETSRSVEAPITSNFAYASYNLFSYDIKIDVTNISQSELVLEDTIDCKIKFEDKDQLTYLKYESEDRSELSETYTLQPGEQVLLHLYTNYDPLQKNPKDVKAVFTIDSEQYVFPVNKNEFDPEKTYLDNGQALTTADGIVIEIQESFTAKDITSSNPEGNSSYYHVPIESQSFVGLKLLITNNGEAEKPINKVLGFRTLKEDQLITDYAGTIVWERSDGTELYLQDTSASAEISLLPSEQTIVYCFTAVSDDKTDEIAEYRIDTLDGTFYIKK